MFYYIDAFQSFLLSVFQLRQNTKPAVASTRLRLFVFIHFKPIVNGHGMPTSIPQLWLFSTH